MRNYADYEVIKLTQELVRIKSTNPGTYEKEIGDFIYEWLSEIPDIEVIRDEFLPGRFNVVAHLKGELEHPNLVFIEHMDIVPEGAGWSFDPYCGDLVDGKIRGRGSVDMKAGLAAAMIAFREIAKTGKKPKYSFMLIATGDEEGDDMAGVEQAIKSGWVDKDSWVLDSEATGLEIVATYKGKIWLKIYAQGAPAHGSYPWAGVDAIAAISEWICSFRRRVADAPVHEELQGCSVSFEEISGGSNTNIVSENAVLRIDMRLVPPTGYDEAVKMVEAAAADAEAAVPGSKITYEIIAKRPVVMHNPEAFLYKELVAVATQVMGKEPGEDFFTGYTDTAVIASTFNSPNCMSFGPGDGSACHKPDESVDCEEILIAEKILIELAKKILY